MWLEYKDKKDPKKANFIKLAFQENWALTMHYDTMDTMDLTPQKILHNILAESRFGYLKIFSLIVKCQ